MPEGYVFGEEASPVGSAQNTVYRSYRPLVTTAATDYNEVDFIFEITVTVRSGNASEGAYVGLGGSTITTPGAFPEPPPAFTFEFFHLDLVDG